MKKIYISALLLCVVLLLSCTKDQESDCVFFCTKPVIEATVTDDKRYAPGEVMYITWRHCGINPELNTVTITAKKQGTGEILVLGENVCLCKEDFMYTIPVHGALDGIYNLVITVNSVDRTTDASKKFIIGR